MYNHEVGCNEEVYEFLKRFWENIDSFDMDRGYNKNFIEYCGNLSQTNINSFIKTIYHKLLRQSSRFELGVEYINMQNENI